MAELTDIFGKSGREWLKSLSHLVTPVDRIILVALIESIEAINQQIDAVSKETTKYASWYDSDVKILISTTGVGVYSLRCSSLQK